MIHQYLMSDKYCENWSEVDGIRELIANAIDSSDSSDVDIRFEDGFGIVSNKSVILDKKHLLMGESYKSDDQIGQFGEGLKIAALVLTRVNNQRVSVNSGDYHYEFFMKGSKDFGKKILHVEIKNRHDFYDGTQIIFNCDEDNIWKAKNLFLCFNRIEELSGGVLLNCNDVYVLGVKVAELENSVFGYNIKDKALMNRDRTILDRNHMDSKVKDILSSIGDKELIWRLISSCLEDENRYENHFYFYPTFLKRQAWKDVISEHYGDLVCLTSEDGVERAKYLGYRVLDFGKNMNQTIQYATDIPYASAVSPDEVLSFVSINNLTAEEKNILYRAKRWMKRTVHEFLANSPEILVTEEMSESTISQSQKGNIVLNRKILESFPKTVGALSHEFVHISYRARDVSHDFEYMMTEMIGDIAVATEEDLFRL